MNYYYSTGGEGMEIHDTAESAREAAQFEMDQIRVIAVEDGEWPDDAGSIEWGELRPKGRAVCHDEGDGCEEWTLEELVDGDMETPEAKALWGKAREMP